MVKFFLIQQTKNSQLIKTERRDENLKDFRSITIT